MKQNTYIAIDLKSFYASVECRERGLDPLNTNLVVADESRTDKTICLAVSPSLKSFGIPGRCRLFEVKQKVTEINAERLLRSGKKEFRDKSFLFSETAEDTETAVDFIIAPPRMAYYIDYSTKIYSIYMKYVSPDDMVVYSIDEVFMDVTKYLDTYKLSAHDLAMKIILDVIETTGITATAGIGTNLYLCKVAMDILAKHIPADENGVRIAELDEMSYRRTMWTHRPITDFWRVGRGYGKKLERRGLYTMGDVARFSLKNEDALYKLFGKNAELLIDHAWGWEPTTIEAIKAYKPDSNSLGSGQVLHSPYTAEKAGLVLREMADALSLNLVDKGLVTNKIVVTVGYDKNNLSDPNRRLNYAGEIKTDHYGREIPKHAHGTEDLGGYTSSTKKITKAASMLFDKITDDSLLIRRLNITALNVISEEDSRRTAQFEQLNLFTDYAEREAQKALEEEEAQRERRQQEAILKIQKKYGKNAILKGMSLEEGSTARDRNEQIGGHKK
ncbi:MAG: DNA methylase [Clostridiales bacterium]|nr:DNA methylase [Clostridiales bacterium]